MTNPAVCPQPRSFRALFLCLALPAALTCAGAPTPIEEFFRPFAVNEARLAPDGRHLAAITSAPDGARSLLVIDLATRQTEAIKAPASLDVGTVRWADATHLVFTDGADSHYSRAIFHGQLGRLSAATRFSSYELTTLLGLPRSRPDRALVCVVVPTTENEGYNHVVELDVNVSAVLHDGRRSKSAVVKTHEGPDAGTVVGWHAVPDGDLRYCVAYANRKFTLHRLESDKEAWIAVPLDLDQYHVAAADPDGQSLWVAHYDGAQGFALQKYNTMTGAFGEPVWRDASYDLATARLHFSRRSGQLVALEYEQKRHFTKTLAEPFTSAFKSVQAAYPNSVLHLLNFSDAEDKLLFMVSSPQDPGRIVLLDLATKSLEPMSEIAPWLNARPLQPMLPMSYKTTEGWKEEGYLTLPAEASAAHQVPLVVLVHSGAWIRDTWDFDATAQWLAARGYAVLQANHRGSRGYVPAISFESRFAFDRMPADLAAATRAATGLEMIDGTRVAILGRGFGGFLALMAASSEPQLYRAAVSVGGTFEWEEFIRKIRSDPANRGEYEMLRDFLGKPGKDRDAFAAMSPLQHADAIQAAVFLAYPENPNVASNQQSRELAGRLKKQGKVCETAVLKSDWFDLRGQASWLGVLQQIDTFLAARLQAPTAN